jgi:hypothetical protein
VYQQEIQRDLVEDVKSETSGDYERALVGTLLSTSEWDAKLLRSFMKGMGELIHLCRLSAAPSV